MPDEGVCATGIFDVARQPCEIDRLVDRPPVVAFDVRRERAGEHAWDLSHVGHPPRAEEVLAVVD